jgi:hypothetical protein
MIFIPVPVRKRASSNYIQKNRSLYREKSNCIFGLFFAVIGGMKIIFLDIDGVLITRRNGSLTSIDSEQNPNGFDENAVRNLNRLIKETGARIVISSSSRLTNSIRQLGVILQCGGVVDPPVLDVTPFVINTETRRSHRGREILSWLEKNPSVTDYVVIDDYDHEHLSGIPRDRIVKTTDLDGFGTDDVYHKALDILHTSTCKSHRN